MECAINNGYSVVRIMQEDIYYNKYNCKNEICIAIEKVRNSKIIQIVYLCKNNEYDIYFDNKDEKPKKITKIIKINNKS